MPGEDVCLQAEKGALPRPQICRCLRPGLPSRHSRQSWFITCSVRAVCYSSLSGPGQWDGLFQYHPQSRAVHKDKSVMVLLLLSPTACLTLCDPMDYTPPGFSVHGIFLDKNTGVGCHFCLQWILPDQGSNPHSPAWTGRFFTTEPPGKPLSVMT